MLKGIKSLASGGLKKWITKTTRACGHRECEASQAVGVIAVTIETEGEDDEDDMWDEYEDGNGEDGLLTFGIMHVRDGEFIIEYEGQDDNRRR